MSARRTWTGPEPEAITAWTLVHAGHVVGRRFHAAFAERGVTPTQFGVLLELDLHPGMSNGQIARAIDVTPQSMSELLRSLEQLGLIQRNPPPGRGHRIPARLTPAGRHTLARCADAVAEVEASLGLLCDQATTLNRLLHHVAGTISPAACRPDATDDEPTG